MKRTPSSQFAAIALVAMASLAWPVIASAQHAEKCEAIPKAQWKPQAELEKKLTDQGWKISRVKITNGCYEVYGRDAKNKKAETFFHPKTLEVVTAPH
ncbi:MAG: PepSY domain-containing protein [Caldimonas sp.]